MDGYQNNSQCILDYLALFHALAGDNPDAGRCRKLRRGIVQREHAADRETVLAPPLLRSRFRLAERDFLLAMAALALELDDSLRSRFRRQFGLHLPTVEYGLRLISPLCPGSCRTLAELAGGDGPLELLLRPAQGTPYPLERSLILCRTALAFLAGPAAARTPGCTLLGDNGGWLDLFEPERRQAAEWFARGGNAALCLCGPDGSGRRTLLRRACGAVVCLELSQLSGLPTSEQLQAMGEAAAQAILLGAPVCAQRGNETRLAGELGGLCRRHGVSLALLAEEDGELPQGSEIIRLPRQLTPSQRALAWKTFSPQAEPGAAPTGSMTVGALAHTAALAERLAEAAGRQAITREDVRRAMLQRSGALELGVAGQPDATLDGMILPESVREQLELICQAAAGGDKLAAWGLPGQREGVTAVFHGPSGTGKTMAACAIANRLGMPLLRADLSAIMDKYVGETEKHLGRLLRCARENHCVLLFDEADVLFGKRSAVEDSQNKYANLSTAYLLQEIEQYDGVALLSTNLLGSFDDAFLRRLQYVVRFPLPNTALRETLWRRAIPREHLEGELPFSVLAQVELSPARIFAAARAAAVAALASGREQIDAPGAAKALRLELEKGGKAPPRFLTELEQGRHPAGVHA